MTWWGQEPRKPPCACQAKDTKIQPSGPHGGEVSTTMERGKLPAARPRAEEDLRRGMRLPGPPPTSPSRVCPSAKRSWLGAVAVPYEIRDVHTPAIPAQLVSDTQIWDRDTWVHPSPNVFRFDKAFLIGVY